MTLLQVIVLALIQGLTEFLPISSSAHLILGGRAFGWPEQGLVFDVATHLGTLIAVLIYFRRDLWRMGLACLHAPTSPEETQARRLAGLIVIASLPALLIGYLASDLVEHLLRDLRVIAYATIGFGLLLWWADARGPRDRSLGELRWNHALIVGLAQVLALIPGTSRSGITITAGRFLGLDAHAAARFSFLLSVPIIGAAGAYGALRVWTGDAQIDWFEFALGAGIAALVGWACIAVFLALVRRIGLMPFVIYRLVLGVVLLFLIW
jgi:undecaprenyl-diphosphatase